MAKYSDLLLQAKQDIRTASAEQKTEPVTAPKEAAKPPVQEQPSAEQAAPAEESKPAAVEPKVLDPVKPAVEPKPPKVMPSPQPIEAKIFGSMDTSMLIPTDYSDYETVEPEGDVPSVSDEVEMEADERDKEIVERDIQKAEARITQPNAQPVRKPAPRQQPKPKSGTAQPKPTAKENVQMARLSWLPKSVVERAKQQFPAMKQDDSVAAYIYFHEGMPADMEVTESVINAALSFSGESVTVETVKDIVEHDLSTIMSQNRLLMRKLDTLELALAYMIYANAGFAKEIPASPDAIKFLERGVADLIDKLESDADFRRQREANRSGRPIR